MRRFVEGAERGQITLFPDRLEDWIGEDNPGRSQGSMLPPRRFYTTKVRKRHAPQQITSTFEQLATYFIATILMPPSLRC